MPLLKKGRALSSRVADVASVVRGRLLMASPFYPHFSGAYRSYQEAMNAIPARKLAGYNHEEIADVTFVEMCSVAPWDYPVIHWLYRLMPTARRILDAGGHMGTKFRAFRDHLTFEPDHEWIVYDVPAIVKAGRQRADADGLTGLSFTDDIASAGRTDIFLASGLLQYVDVPFPELLSKLREKPRHIIINKLAVREGATVVTLENFGKALVPYQIRSREPFFAELQALGYSAVDEWVIPTLSHVIPTHPELGASKSIGCYLRLE